MKILIDCTILSEKQSGKRMFLVNFLNYLFKNDKKNEYILLSNVEFDNFYELPKNFKRKILKGKRNLIWLLKLFFIDKFIIRSNIYFSPREFDFLWFHKNSILVIHDLNEIKFPELFEKKWQSTYEKKFRKALKYAKIILTPSVLNKNYLISKFKIKSKKIIKIDEPVSYWTEEKVSKERINKVLKKYHISKNFFLFVGTIEKRKNIDMLLIAFKKFKIKDKKFKLVLVGPNGFGYEEISKKIIDLNLTQDVILTGFVDESELRPFFSAAKAFVLPSFSEGYPLSVFEAMACEVPVITTVKNLIGKVPEELIIKIDPTNIDSIVEALKFVKKQNEKIKEITRNAYQFVKKINEKKGLKKILSLFDK